MTTATHATVTINSIRVIDSSVNTTAEPGSSAEWYMTFTVNGQTAQWSNDSVKDNTVYAVNRVFPNVPLGPNGMVSIQATGYEHDTFSANDILPMAQRTLHPAEDYQLGATDWIPSDTSSEGSYSIEYTIRPAQPGQALTASREYVSVYRAGNGGYALWSGNWNSFTKKWKELSASGQRLVRLATFRADTNVLTFGNGTERIFTGTFTAGTDGHALWVSEWPAFQAKWTELTKNGLRLVDIAPYLDGGKRMFAGVFRAGTDGHALWVSEWPAFEAKWKELTKQGLRLVALDTYKDGAKRMFAGVYRAGAYGHSLWVGMNWKQFQAKRLEQQAANLRLVDVASYVEGSEQRFAGVFRAGTDQSALKRGSWDDFVSDWQQLSKAGLRLTSVDTFVDASEE
jgi:hypothetical protein